MSTTPSGSEASKVLLLAMTGRRHQLRAHALAIGHPVVGDYTYAGDDLPPRMMLHAYHINMPTTSNIRVPEGDTVMSIVTFYIDRHDIVNTFLHFIFTYFCKNYFCTVEFSYFRLLYYYYWNGSISGDRRIIVTTADPFDECLEGWHPGVTFHPITEDTIALLVSGHGSQLVT